MIAPLAAARTTAREVQLRGVPVSTHGLGRDVSKAHASRGTGTAAAAAPAGRPNSAGEHDHGTQADRLRSVRARCCG